MSWKINPSISDLLWSIMKHAYLFLILLVACDAPIEDAQEVIDRSIEAHHANYLDKRIAFEFRERSYSVHRKASGYVYTRMWEDDSLGLIEDILVNSHKFTRTINGDTVLVDEEWSAKYASSVNSVLYFFQVPLILNDRAANKKLLDRVEINGRRYYPVQVTFDQEGGGEDFEDVFVYWIHDEDFTVDYFAYQYSTDGGGVRFREAVNRYTLDGHVFQDYINYEVTVGTALASIPALWENDELNELSRIENKNVRITNF